MSRTRTRSDDAAQSTDSEPYPIRAVVRTFSALNVIAGLIGLVGPAVTGNDDDGPINLAPGLFLGKVAINGPHALMHVMFGLLGLRSSRDAASARRHMGRLSVFFGAFAAVGWRTFGFERGVHMIAGIAVDGWGNLGHTAVSLFGLFTFLRSKARSE